MRVTRRTRPSQVGFAASIGRRRLLQTFDAHPVDSRIDPLSTDGLRLVIRLDFSPADAANIADAERQDAEATRFQPAVAASSSARGR
jgi:hypothetical protein